MSKERKEKYKKQDTSIKKYFVTPNELTQKSFLLGKKINESFNPTFIVALWRGGCYAGTIVQEYLSFKGIKTDHISVRTSHYTDIDKTKKEVRVYGMNYIIDKCNKDDRLLIIDDVFDTGKSIEAVIEYMKKKMRRNTPKEIKIGVIFYKPKRNLTKIIPNFYVEETNEWIVFPHELEGLSEYEIKEKNKKIYDIIKE